MSYLVGWPPKQALSGRKVVREQEQSWEQPCFLHSR